MLDFFKGIIDFWAVAAFHRRPESYQRFVVSQAYYAGHVTGALSFFAAMLAVAVGVGVAAYYWWPA